MQTITGRLTCWVPHARATSMLAVMARTTHAPVHHRPQPPPASAWGQAARLLCCMQGNQGIVSVVATNLTNAAGVEVSLTILVRGGGGGGWWAGGGGDGGRWIWV